MRERGVADVAQQRRKPNQAPLALQRVRVEPELGRF